MRFTKIWAISLVVLLVFSGFIFAANAQQYLAQGNKFFKAKQYSKAIQYYQQSAKMKPSTSAYYYMGLSYYMMGKKPEALRNFQYALKYDPRNAKAKNMVAKLKGGSSGGGKAKQYLVMGHKNLKAKKYAQAIKYYNASAKIQPTYQAYQFMGTAYYYKGDTANAKMAFEKSLQLNPNNPGVRNILAKISGGSGSGGGEPRLSQAMGVHPLLLAGLFAGAIAVLFLF